MRGLTATPAAAAATAAGRGGGTDPTPQASARLCSSPPHAAQTPLAAGAEAAKPAGLWLPQCCCEPLHISTGPQQRQTGRAPSSSCWKVLLPQPAPCAQHSPELAAGQHHPSNSCGSTGSGDAISSPRHGAVLTYSHVSEMVQHSRQLQKLQQLLLQLAVESQAAPRLLVLLLQCCQQLQTGDAAPQAQQPRAPGSDVITLDRCCALYRLVSALTAGPVKERGLGAGCQVAVEAEVHDRKPAC